LESGSTLADKWRKHAGQLSSPPKQSAVTPYSTSQDATQTSHHEITESVTTRRVFQLPNDVVTQIVSDAKKQVAAEIAKIEARYQALFRQMEAAQTQDSEGTELEDQALKKVKPELDAKYRGDYVAVSYGGKIIASARTITELLDGVRELAIPKDQFFIFGVPLKN